MFGLLFAMPLYFQDVRGVDALGSGVRLLPLVGGMLVGMVGGTRVQSPRKGPGGQVRPPLAGARPVVAIGFFIMAAAMALGALTTVSSSTGYSEAWVAIAGLGLGMSMPSAMNIALGELSAERSGSGSALITAMRQVGGTIGVAILGTLISNGYASALSVQGLPAAAASAARAASPAAWRWRRSLAPRRSCARCGRVRARHGHHAVGLRRDRAGGGAARGRVLAQAVIAARQ